MNPERFARLREILLTLGRLPASRRDTYLDQACAGDPELRREAESLIGWDESSRIPAAARTGGAPAMMGLAPMSHLVGSRPPLPERIGPFRILGVLGEGGMGVVYRAEQTDPIRREVAVKRVSTGGDRRPILARFEAERQILALMEHPGIARVYEAGTDESNQPYFVMELVRGVPITEYCRANALTLRARLRLFHEVCHAVQHAHQKGVIHRDLKPSNILVTEQEGKAVPKVIDFGIAKAIGGGPAGESLTRDGQLVGTLDYMSPEQAGGRSADVDTRSDVYSLGVVLYELLTGTLPYETAAGSLVETARVIAETPPRPIRRPATGEARVDPDLSTIVLKALDKEPSRRYPSASALAEDVNRFLEGQAILAHPPSAVYQLRKLIGRHRTPFALAAALFALALIYAVSVSLLFAGQRRERLRAERESVEREEISRFLVDLFHPDDSSVKPPDEVTARELIDSGMARLEAESLTPESRARLLAAVGEAAYKLGLRERSREILERSLEQSRSIFGPRSLEVGEISYWLGEIFVADRNSDRAVSLLETSAQILGELRGLDSELALGARLTMVAALCDRGDPGRGEQEVNTVLRLLRRRSQPDSLMIIRAQAALARVYRSQDRIAEAEPLYRATLASARHETKLSPSELALLLNNLAFLLMTQERLSEAAPCYREALEVTRNALGERHPNTLRVLSNLASLQARLKRYDEAESLMAVQIRITEMVYPQRHWRVGSAYGSLGVTLMEAGRPAEARFSLGKRADIYRESLGADHLWTAYAEAHLAACCLALKDRPAYQGLIGHCDRLLSSPASPWDGDVRAGVREAARLYEQYGFSDRAEHYRRLIAADSTRAALAARKPGR